MSNNVRKKEKQTIQIIKLIHKLDKCILPLFLGAAIIETVIPFINIGMPALILDALYQHEKKERIISLVALAVLLNVAILLILAVLDYLKSWRSFQFANKYNWEKTKCILTMDYQYLEDVNFINIKQNIRHNDENMGIMAGLPGRIAGLFRSCLTVIMSSIAFIVMILQVILNNKDVETKDNSPWFFIFLLLFVIITIWVVGRMQKKVAEKVPVMTEETVSTNRVGMYLVESVIHNYVLGKDIRIFGIDKLVINEMEKMEQNLSEFQRKVSAISSLPGAISGASSAIISGMVFFVVSVYSLAGAIGIGSVVWTVGIVQQFISSVTSLIFGIGDFSISCARLSAVIELFQLPKIKHNQGNQLPIEQLYELEFCNVSFKYPESEKWILRNFSMKIEKGKRFAIVGMNGSGKTTIIKLLCRLYDPTEGEILLNKVNIKEYSEQEYQNLFSVVFQDFSLFSFTLGENLSVSTEYKSEKAELALEKIGFYRNRKILEKGLATPLYRDYDEDGVQISGGEAQKIAIARALYRDAPFVILDEPTAALDPIAEQDIYENFNTLIGGKTAVYISHRLSSCRFCDKIMVIDKGALIQQGKHDELVRQKDGKYFELWNAQAQYYN